MIDRIARNEERLDRILASVNELETALTHFEENKRDFELLNKYYGSKNWFKDKEYYEKGKIPMVKAGVLSEDAVWSLDEKIGELVSEMQDIITKLRT